MPKKRRTHSAPSYSVKEKTKGPSGLTVSVQIDSPWGHDTIRFSMTNPQGNIPKPKQNSKAFSRAIYEGLRAEFGGKFVQE